MSSLLVFNSVYRLKIQPVPLVFSTPLVNCCLSTLSLTSPTPPPLAVGGRGVLNCVVDHILQEFKTLFLTRFRTYKTATPPQTKTPVKTTFRDRCFYSSFVHGPNTDEVGNVVAWDWDRCHHRWYPWRRADHNCGWGPDGPSQSRHLRINREMDG